MKKRRPLLIIIAIVSILTAIWSYVLLSQPPQQTLDQRVHDVASQLKCLVCQGESVADSPALLSQQMRAIIHQQLQSGKSEQEVIQYFRDHYGDRILLAPPKQGFTVLAWIVPIAILIGGAVLLFFVLQGWQTKTKTTLSTGETQVEDADQADLERFKAQLAQELAADDTLFAPVSSAPIRPANDATASSFAQAGREEKEVN
jgi:cytochrome c-type biogenesis protein CcmH